MHVDSLAGSCVYNSISNLPKLVAWKEKEMSLDNFTNNLCLCGHSISEEHELGKCFALDFNGAIYIACDCRNIRVASYSIGVDINESPNENSDTTNFVFVDKRIRREEDFQNPPLGGGRLITFTLLHQ